MSIRLLAAALAVIAVPVAVPGQRPALTSQSEQWSDRRYCVVYNHVGSRLVNARRCHSKAQRDELRREARQLIEHIQIIKTHGR